MPKSTQEEKYRWIKPILERCITIKNLSKVCPFSERTIKYWLANYRKYWKYLEVYSGMGNDCAIKLLNKIFEITSFRILVIKTDNGSFFTNKYTGYNKSTDSFNPKSMTLILCAEIEISFIT